MGIRVQSCHETYGVALHVTANSRVVVPPDVIGKVCFLVEALLRQPEVELEQLAVPVRVLVGWVVAERLLLLPLPK